MTEVCIVVGAALRVFRWAVVIILNKVNFPSFKLTNPFVYCFGNKKNG